MERLRAGRGYSSFYSEPQRTLNETIFRMTGAVKRLVPRLGWLLAHPVLWAFLRRRGTRYAGAWLAAAATAAIILHSSWNIFNLSDRVDGNSGHIYIDFGGQYVMGRMLVRGHGGDLYNRVIQRQVLREVYLPSTEVPLDKRDPGDRDTHDVDGLMATFMGADEPNGATRIASIPAPLSATHAFEVVVAMACSEGCWEHGPLERARIAPGGPLYPPVNAFLCYPLALLPPQLAYRVAQILGIVLALLAGLGLRQIARGRVWWPVASMAVMLFPGYVGSLNLGQNATLTLFILVWGWALIARGWQVAGGGIWGLFAFKPVWGLAFLLVPAFTARWRTCLAMGLVAVVSAALTVPVVGWHSWRQWLQICGEATKTYKSDPNWIHLSRDVLTIPRKWLDLEAPDDERRSNVPAAVVGWGVLAAVLEVTLRLATLRQRRLRRAAGVGPAFLFLASWLTCFHFMYYDVLLALLPTFLLFTDPRRYVRPALVAVIRLARDSREEDADQMCPRRRQWQNYYRPRLATAYPMPNRLDRGGTRGVWVLNRFVPTLVVVMVALYATRDLHAPPWETYAMAVLWVWCSWQIGRHPGRTRVNAGHTPATADLASALPTQQLQELRSHSGSAH